MNPSHQWQHKMQTTEEKRWDRHDDVKVRPVLGWFVYWGVLTTGECQLLVETVHSICHQGGRSGVAGIVLRQEKCQDGQWILFAGGDIRCRRWRRSGRRKGVRVTGLILTDWQCHYNVFGDIVRVEIAYRKFVIYVC